MASHLLWFRLPKGRVWHVAASGALVALCGQSIPARGERQPKRPPFGARPCPDCDAVSSEACMAIGSARLAQGKVLQPAPAGLVVPDMLAEGMPAAALGPFHFAGESVTASGPLGDPLDLTIDLGFPVCEDCGHAFGNHDSLGVCQDVDENGDACECSEYLALCTCGHPWALHDVDTGECCLAPLDGEPTCTCEQFRSEQ